MNLFRPPAGPRDPLHQARTHAEAGWKALSQGSLSEALMFYTEAFRLRAEALGSEHREVVETAVALADGMEPLLKQEGAFAEVMAFFRGQVEHLRRGEGAAESEQEQSRRIAVLLELLGNRFNAHDLLDEARELYQLAVEIYTREGDAGERSLLFLLQKIVGIEYNLGNLEAAKATLEQVLALDEKLFGADHPKLAADLSSMGNIYRDMGSLSEARGCYERSVSLGEKSLNWDNPRLAADVAALSAVQRQMGDLPAAHASLRRLVTIDEQTFGARHPKVANDLLELADLLIEMNEKSSARAVLAQALDIDESAFGPGAPRTAADLSRLAELDRQMGRLADALESYRRAVAILKAAYGDDHLRVAEDLARLGVVEQALGERPAAREHLGEALAIFERFLPSGDPRLAEVAAALESLGQDGASGAAV